MYYNPETKATASREDLMVQFNASIPESAEEVNGWHLIDEQILYPSFEASQIAVPEGIELHEGKYARLEQAFLDLAQMVSNLEDYRMLAEREKEEAEHSEENQPAE